MEESKLILIYVYIYLHIMKARKKTGIKSNKAATAQDANKELRERGQE